MGKMISCYIVSQTSQLAGICNTTVSIYRRFNHSTVCRSKPIVKIPVVF